MNGNRVRRMGAWLLLVTSVAVPAGAKGRTLEWSSRSDEAKNLLREVHARVENFQFGPATADVARKVVAADPRWALGMYYLSATTPPPENQTHLDKAVELAKNAPEGERRFIETMSVARANNGANFAAAGPALEKLAADYPGERFVWMILGQVHQAAGAADKARAAFERAQAIAPSNRARALLANDDLLKGRYAQARATFEAVKRDLPQGATPFAVYYGITFSHLYEGQVDAAIRSLEEFLPRYKESGAAQTQPEVFIWNAIARINLENGRLDAAMKAYEKGYESVPGSGLPEDQKQTWLGRLHHGKCRVLAKMGKHEEAWSEAETVRGMIEKGGEQAKQFLPAYHYLAGYLMLERGDAKAAVEHLKQADPDDAFHQLLLARAHERLGDKDGAKKIYASIVANAPNGLERALAFPEAKRKL